MVLSPSLLSLRAFSLTLSFALSSLALTACCRGSSDTSSTGGGTAKPTPAAAPAAPPKTQAQIDACKAKCNAQHKVPMERLQCYIPCN